MLDDSPDSLKFMFVNLCMRVLREGLKNRRLGAQGVSGEASLESKSFPVSAAGLSYSSPHKPFCKHPSSGFSCLGHFSVFVWRCEERVWGKVRECVCKRVPFLLLYETLAPARSPDVELQVCLCAEGWRSCCGYLWDLTGWRAPRRWGQ